MSLSNPLLAKQPRLWIRDGIDQGRSEWLADAHITLGSAPGCTIQLQDPDAHPKHLTLIPPATDAAGKPTGDWTFVLADDPYALVNGVAGLRNGTVKAPMTFRLGPVTMVEVIADDVDEHAPESVQRKAMGGSKMSVPISAYGGVMMLLMMVIVAAMAVGVAWSGWLRPLQEASPPEQSLTVAAAFCALNPPSGNAEGAAFWADVAPCMGLADASALSAAERGLISDRITDIALAISAEDPGAAAEKLRNLTQRLSVGQCDLAERFAADAERVMQSAMLESCGTPGGQ